MEEVGLTKIKEVKKIIMPQNMSNTKF